jgi:hypothetical protein
MMLLAALGFALAVPAAHAGKCDAALAKANGSADEALAPAFTALAACDAELAAVTFKDLLPKAKDSDALHALSLAAVQSNVWQPVWKMPGYISDYSVRDEVVSRIGAECGTQATILTFLQAAYGGLKDIEFQRWEKALVACEAPSLAEWMVKEIEKPPAKLYDEKYNTLVGIYTKRTRAAALPTLTKAAIAAAAAGPFDGLLAQMDEAVAPTMGQEISAEDKEKLEAALVDVARAVDKEKAKAVADRLATSGSQRAAARLLPTIYPDRVQGGGTFLYGAASVELGDCKGKKTAVIHLAEVTDPGKRWVILSDVEAPLRAVKPKLKGCEIESPWGVSGSPEPVKDGKGVEAWAATLQKQLEGKGYEVDIQSEKAIKLN